MTMSTKIQTLSNKSCKDRTGLWTSGFKGCKREASISNNNTVAARAFTRSCNRRNPSSSCPPSTFPTRSTGPKIETRSRRTRHRSSQWRKCRILNSSGWDFLSRPRPPRATFIRSCTGSVDPDTISRPWLTLPTSSSRLVSIVTSP